MQETFGENITKFIVHSMIPLRMIEIIFVFDR